MAAADIRPSMDSALAALGQPATVTAPGGAPVTTRVLWLTPDTVEYPSGAEHRRAVVRREAAIPLDGLSQVPRGTVINAKAHNGAAASDWEVDDIVRVDFDHYRVVVVPVPA